jgi:hypothetical protein
MCILGRTESKNPDRSTSDGRTPADGKPATAPRIARLSFKMN